MIKYYRLDYIQKLREAQINGKWQVFDSKFCISEKEDNFIFTIKGYTSFFLNLISHYTIYAVNSGYIDFPVLRFCPSPGRTNLGQNTAFVRTVF